MKKVIIIGCPGAGKSYFAKKLRSITGIPLYHLDMIWHKPDKTHISRPEFDEALKRIFSEDKWIMDGDFSRTMEMRMQACDTIILFDIPYEVCLQGIRERAGTKRDDMPWETAETDDVFLNEVKKYIPEQLPKVYQLLDKYKHNKEVIVFKTREEAEKWLMKIPDHSSVGFQ
ncbi:MAG: adenylate kinase [Ruminiclostridium sp.]|nr:adenylate kinase [Ruminiclostridium sp.]